MSLILSIHSGPHDSSAALYDDYDNIAAVHKERLTGRKSDGHFPNEAIDEVLRIGGVSRKDVAHVVLSRGSYPARYMRFSPAQQLRMRLHRKKGRERHKSLAALQQRQHASLADEMFKKDYFLSDNDFMPATTLSFANHHFAHALSAFFYTTFDNALLYTADGGGDGVYYSSRIFQNNNLVSLFGDDRHFFSQEMNNSLGLAYGYCTRMLGYKMNRHEGKLTGLAAYGKPELADQMMSFFNVSDNGEIGCAIPRSHMEKTLISLSKDASSEVVAASIQHTLERLIVSAVQKQMQLYGTRQLALAGGVFANVKLNQRLAALPECEDMFIFPAMGDDGLSVGGALCYLLERDGLDRWCAKRRTIDNVYWGGGFSLEDAPLPDGIQRTLCNDSARQAAELIANGKVGAIYSARMEFGPRALGARSIIAAPVQRDINDTLNKRLDRSDFMPFAPYVLEEDADQVFVMNDASRYAARFMTVTTDVQEEWRERIPAVVHVDGTARPQVVNDAINPLYASILREYKNRTGIAVLINTSFNVHEHPIVNTPEECLRALKQKRIDFVVTEKAVYSC